MPSPSENNIPPRILRHWSLPLLILSVLIASTLLFPFAVFPLPPQPVPKVFVDNFQVETGAQEMREEVIARLRASRRVSLVDNASQADLVVRGDGAVWLKGFVAINPRPSAGSRQPVYGGFLSLQVEHPNGQMVWSHMVTPGRMHWNGVIADMADHIVQLMLAAIPYPGGESTPTSAPLSEHVILSGAGSTFAAPLYQSWVESFAQLRPGFRITYQPVGSEAGIELLREGKVDFAASDVPISNAPVAPSSLKVEQFATVLGGVVAAYNLPGVTRDLRFTPEILARIYLGKIVRWNDPQLREVNHGVNLPDSPIVVLHRSDGSGTTFAWTKYLSLTNKEWEAAVGTGMRVEWPTGEGLAGNESVAARVAKTPGAIGYVELTYAIRNRLSFGLVRNAAGQFVQANLDTLGAAASQALTGDVSASLVNAPGKDTYPIATFTWLLLPSSSGNDSEKSAALHQMLRWMLTDGQRQCSALGYVPLPMGIAEKELTGILDGTGQPTGNPKNR